MILYIFYRACWVSIIRSSIPHFIPPIMQQVFNHDLSLRIYSTHGLAIGQTRRVTNAPHIRVLHVLASVLVDVGIAGIIGEPRLFYEGRWSVRRHDM